MRISSFVIPVFALGIVALSPVGARAGAAPEEAISVLQKRGYTSIKIEPSETPGYQATACKGGTRFAISMSPESNIVDVDPRGSCAKQQKRYAAAPPSETQSRVGEKSGEYGAGPEYGNAEITYAPLLDKLYRKGYYDLRIVDVDEDEIEVLACRNRRLFKIDIRLRTGRIDDIDRKGRCGPRRRAGRNNVVEAPFTSVRTGRGRVDVEAPFTGVHVGQGEVHIRAPFVDLRIPR